MKKLIGVIAIMLTLILTVIYRQLTARPAKDRPTRAHISARLREGMALSYLLFQ
ncbi:MAG TPA: hypothetical protein VG605_03050 [Puia sp.]|nr:hypothetical protein [Puia sp.]